MSIKQEFNPLDYLKEGTKYQLPTVDKKDLKDPFIFESEDDRLSFGFIPVDNWVMSKKDSIFTYTKGSLIANVSEFYEVNPEDTKGLDYFMVSQKKCYNSTKMQIHMCRYLNYFEKFYDKDLEYQACLFYIKYLIDFEKKYNKQCLVYDLKRYLLSESIINKVKKMVEDNYALNLTYKNQRNASLQYTNDHAKILLVISIVMNLMIPILTHFSFIKKVEDIDSFLLEMYDLIFDVFSDVDIYNKIYETCYTNIVNNRNKNEGVWNKQDIRGKNITTHSISSADNIILNIMPKYTFEQNIVSFNYSSILTNTKYQVSDIAYEYTYIPLSSSKMDADNTSDFDRFESFIIRQNEALYLQNKMNCEGTMKIINNQYGPFNRQEISFYMDALNGDSGETIINGFQKQLIFNLFFKYFGDTTSIYAINKEDYVKLMLAGKHLLLAHSMILLPYIISSKVEKLISRKSINKKELARIENSALYPQVIHKYRSSKITKSILQLIATIISSDFSIIDFNDPLLNGKHISIQLDMIVEEVLSYILLI